MMEEAYEGLLEIIDITGEVPKQYIGLLSGEYEYEEVEDAPRYWGEVY